MAEETTKQKIEQPENPIVLNAVRNGITTVGTEARTTKGAGAGKVTFDWEFKTDGDTPFTPEQDAAIVLLGLTKEAYRRHKFLGAENLSGLIDSTLRRYSTEIAETSLDANGLFSQDIFLKEFVEFDSAGESKSDLEEKLEKVMKELLKVIATPATTDAEKTAKDTNITTKGQEMQRIQSAIDKKTRKSKKADAVATPA